MLTDYAYLKPKITRRAIMMIINIVGFLFIGLIVWWFWLYKPAETEATKENRIKVVVNNGIYQPARIKVKAGTPALIEFVREDTSPCAAMVLFPDFEISEELSLNESKLLELPAMVSGEYPFHCQMQMYKGLLIVE